MPLILSYTPKVKVKTLALGVFSMTKISKEIKLRALTEYFAGRGGIRVIDGKTSYIILDCLKCSLPLIALMVLMYC